MTIIIFRHGPAGNSEAWAAEGKSDASRPLTEQGRDKTVKGAQGLKSEVEDLDLIATSPYVRCRQTADVLADAYPGAKLIELPSLRPGGSLDKTISWLGSLKGKAAVALIGHEPGLGLLTSRLLSGKQGAFIRLKKGAAAILEAPVPVKPGRAVLHCLAQPRHLRRLGKKAS